MYVWATLERWKSHSETYLWPKLNEYIKQNAQSEISAQPTDFEAMAIFDLKEMFHSVEINGCYIHVNNVCGEECKTNEYRENKNIRLYIQMYSAPAWRRRSGWVKVNLLLSENANLSQSVDCFIERWLKNEEIAI